MKIILGFIFLSMVNAGLKDSTSKIYVGTGLSIIGVNNDTQYQTIASQEFNCFTSIRQFQWSTVEPVSGSPNYTSVDQLFQFANGSKIRAQPLIWYHKLPNWLLALQNNRSSLDMAMTQHISELVNYTVGQVYSWDVVNEVLADDGNFRRSIWWRHFGLSFIAKAFRTANTIDPNAKLYINEYGVYGQNRRKTEAYYNLVKRLLSSGVPIHGVGFQCHLTVGHFPNTFSATMQRFANLGLDVAITELDVRIRSPVTATVVAQQAKDYTRAFTICGSISRCVGVTVFQFSDKYGWLANLAKGYGYANLWDTAYNPKQAYNSTLNALQSI